MISKLKYLVEDTQLTQIEKEILYSMQKGLSSEEISLLLNCNREMIGKHRRNILQKTNCVTMFDVVAQATKKGWI